LPFCLLALISAFDLLGMLEVHERLNYEPIQGKGGYCRRGFSAKSNVLMRPHCLNSNSRDWYHGCLINLRMGSQVYRLPAILFERKVTS
jgi:hypothetical protein